VGTYGEGGGDAGLGLLGDPTRRAIFERLAQRPRSVGELAGELPVSRPDGYAKVTEAADDRRPAVA
jgi:DNA-binding transcriptional ArsR family regulator